MKIEIHLTDSVEEARAKLEILRLLLFTQQVIPPADKEDPEALAEILFQLKLGKDLADVSHPGREVSNVDIALDLLAERGLSSKADFISLAVTNIEALRLEYWVNLEFGDWYTNYIKTNEET